MEERNRMRGKEWGVRLRERMYVRNSWVDELIYLILGFLKVSFSSFFFVLWLYELFIFFFVFL